MPKRFSVMAVALCVCIGVGPARAAARISGPSYSTAGTIAASSDSERTRVVRLLTQARDLFGRAVVIVANPPHTLIEAAQIAAPSSSGGRFYREERRFQDETRDGPNVFQINSLGLRAAELNLSTVDEFLYAAVFSTLGCNRHDGELNLRVARAFIAEIQRDIDGRGSEDWSPPDITDQVDGHALCR